MLKGFYKIYLNGTEVLESKNIITDGGKETIKQFLTGNIPSWSGAIAIGALDSPADVADTKLGFEIDRAHTLTKTVDGSGMIVLRTSFPLDLKAKINEIGVYPFKNTTANGKYQDSVISDFSEGSWIGGTEDSTNSYVGSKRIILDSSHTSTELSGISIDLSGYSKSDKIELLLDNLDSNAKVIIVDFSDGLNTDTFTFYISSTGLQAVSQVLGDKTVSVATSITLTSFSTYKDVAFDCLKFLNADESGYATNLVSRSVTSETIIKEAGQDLEIEYYLAGL